MDGSSQGCHMDGSGPRTRTDRGGRLLTAAGMTATLVVAALMLLQGHAPDPWTALLVAAAATVVVTMAPRLRARRSPGAPLHDDVDPQTGVGNARAALALVDRELDRAANYESVFSLAVVEFDHDLFASTPSRQVRRTMGTLYHGVADDVRLGDRVCRIEAADRDLMLVVLPDTGSQGARTFTERLLAQVEHHLATEGLSVVGMLRTDTLSHPGDDEALAALRRRLSVLDGADALIRDLEVGPARARATA